jgi:hypothetical protein
MKHLKHGQGRAGSTEYPYDFVALEDIGVEGPAHSGTENSNAEEYRGQLNGLDKVDDLPPLLLCHPISRALDGAIPTASTAEIEPAPCRVRSEGMFVGILASMLFMLSMGGAAGSAWLLLTAY